MVELENGLEYAPWFGAVISAAPKRGSYCDSRFLDRRPQHLAKNSLNLEGAIVRLKAWQGSVLGTLSKPRLRVKNLMIQLLMVQCCKLSYLRKNDVLKKGICGSQRLPIIRE